MLDEPVLTEQKSTSNNSRLVLWLLVLSLSGFFVPLYLISVTIEERTLAMATEEADLQATLIATPAPDPQEETLRSEFIDLQNLINTLANLNQTLDTAHIDWPYVMSAVGRYNPAQLNINSLSQTERVITLTGQATLESVVLAYVETLKETGPFETVLIESIQLAPSAADQEDAGDIHTQQPVGFTLVIELKASTDVR